MTNRQKAAAIGEYVRDAIDVYVSGDYENPRGNMLPAITLEEIAKAAKQATHYARLSNGN